MATTNNYYINGPSLASATAVFTNSDLTIKAPDGWYSFEGIVRQQVDGVLLPQQNCGGEFVPIGISVVAATYEAACELELTTYCYNDPVVPNGILGLITVGDTVYSDYCAQELLDDGYYYATGYINAFGANWFQVVSGIVVQVGACNGCTSYTIEIEFGTGGANFLNCVGEPSEIQVTAASGPDTAFFCAIPGSITTYGDVSIYTNEYTCF
jgi:hypothetical protein